MFNQIQIPPRCISTIFEICLSGANTRFILVDGAEHTPENIHDRNLLYEGPDPFFQIPDIFDNGETRHFSVFAINDTGSASTLLQFTDPQDIKSSENDEDGAKMSLITKFILSLIAAVFLWFGFILRRKNEKEGRTIDAKCRTHNARKNRL